MMYVTRPEIPGVLLLQSEIFRDARGHFLESYNRRELARAGINQRFVQDNVACSARNVVRGLHYQGRHPQGKLVRPLHGSIYAVALDIRTDSLAFGKHYGVQLDADDGHALWIPPGLAHGFSVISEAAVVLYKMTNYWTPQFERTLRWDDPDLHINWPLSGPAVLSANDQAGLPFRLFVLALPHAEDRRLRRSA